MVDVCAVFYYTGLSSHNGWLPNLLLHLDSPRFQLQVQASASSRKDKVLSKKNIAKKKAAQPQTVSGSS